jgi:hypothetical protein
MARLDDIVAFRARARCYRRIARIAAGRLGDRGLERCAADGALAYDNAVADALCEHAIELALTNGLRELAAELRARRAVELSANFPAAVADALRAWLEARPRGLDASVD